VSWEAFTNEFIGWRKLPSRLLERNFRSTLIGIFEALDEPPPNFEKNEVWFFLNTLNDLRNELVHHKAKPWAGGKSPRNLLSRLRAIGLVAVAPQLEWESQVLKKSVASWACATVGKAIVELESIPNKRSRALTHVRELIGNSQAIIDGKSDA
jgi:hypothetical protein